MSEAWTKTVIYGNENETWFYDECGPDEIDSFKNANEVKVYGMFPDYAKVYHPCNRSELYEDMTGYVDEVNPEIYGLDDNEKYIVCYFKCDKNMDLLSFVDMDISKEQIIENIEAQKYREGANIFLAKELVPLA